MQPFLYENIAPPLSAVLLINSVVEFPSKDIWQLSSECIPPLCLAVLALNSVAEFPSKDI